MNIRCAQKAPFTSEIRCACVGSFRRNLWSFGTVEDRIVFIRCMIEDGSYSRNKIEMA